MAGIERATARVIVTLEIEVDDSWGSDCTVSQVHKQAEESAVGKLRNALKGWGKTIVIIGKPDVTMISHTQKH